jgi:hypothetical protein
MLGENLANISNLYLKDKLYANHGWDKNSQNVFLKKEEMDNHHHHHQIIKIWEFKIINKIWFRF